MRARAGASWLPAAIGLAGLSAVLLLWHSLRTVERDQLTYLARAEAVSAGNELQRDMESVLKTFARFTLQHVDRIRAKGPFELELTALEATLWVEPSGRVSWVSPLEGHPDLINTDLTASEIDRDALTRARESGQPTTSRSFALPEGKSTFHLIVPVGQRSELQGFIVGVFSGGVLYSGVLQHYATRGWALAVSDKDRELYRSGSPVDGRWLAEATVQVLDTERRLLAGPDPDLRARLHSSLPGVVLATGSVITLLLAASVGLAQSARRRAHDAEAAQAALRESEARFRNIVTTAREGIWTLDFEGRTTYVNPRMSEMLGFTSEEIVGRSLEDFTDEEDRRTTKKIIERLRAGIEESRDVHLRRKDGTDLWTTIGGSPLFGPDGGFVGGLAMVTDHTEQQRAEETLRRSEARMKAVLDAALDAVIMMDAQGRVASWNARARTLFGFSSDEAVGRTLADLIIPHRYRDAHNRGLSRFLATGEGPVLGRRIELSALRRDGSEFPIELTITVLREGDSYLFNAFVADITERKRAQQRLSAQHAATRVLAEVSTLEEAAPRMLEAVGAALGWSVGALWTIDRADGTMRCQTLWRPSPGMVPKFEALTREIGLPHGGGLPGRVWRSGEAAWIPDISADTNLPRLAVALSEGLRSAFAFPIRFRDNVVAVVEFFNHERREPDPELVKILVDLGRQVEHFWQRRRAEKAMKAAQERLAHVVASSPAVLYTLKVEGEQLLPAWVSANIERLSGYAPEEVVGPDWWFPRVHPDDRESVTGQVPKLLPEGYVSREYRFRRKDDTYCWVRDEQIVIRDAAGHPLEVVGSLSDVTETKRLEAQLLQSQKMESVGRLAGGVAHDFNNLLGVITGYGELLQRDIGPSHPGFRRVEEIQKAAERAAGLTRQLLAFSRKQVLEPRVLDLNAVVSNTASMLHRLIGEDVQLITVFGEGLGRVKADPGQVEQVIVNLVVNARDAMREGGKLIIETGNVNLDAAYVRSRPDAGTGPHVMLAVSDTGHGMNAETLTHMFEPFFTTKEQGKGTGLGLATVHGIIRQSGGHVTVYSEPGRGTTFKVYLPRFDEEQEAVASPAVVEVPPSGTETILVVEDESSLRVMIGEILESAGYKVLEGATPEEALAAAGSHGGPLPLILTDVILPGMSGRELADALRSSRPEARVLFMSGYTDDAIGHHGILQPGVHFLQKPFTTDSLLVKVREVLDAPVAG